MPRPYASEISLIFFRAPEPMPYSFSPPRTTFSRTVKLSASMKCWCTMPMPCSMASPGLENETCSPLIAMVPSSGFCMP